MDGSSASLRRQAVLATYLGGFLSHPTKATTQVAEIWFGAAGLEIRLGFRTRFIVPPQECDVLIEGPDQVAQRFSATALALFGPLGLAMKKDVKRAYLIVKTSDGEGVFETDGDTPMDLRGRLGPWISAYRQGTVVTDVFKSCAASAQVVMTQSRRSDWGLLYLAVGLSTMRGRSIQPDIRRGSTPRGGAIPPQPGCLPTIIW